MAERVPFPIERATAHDVVRALLDDTEPSHDVDPSIAACACLRSDDPEMQRDGAELLAALCDDDAQQVETALYDLAAALDADGSGPHDPRARAHAAAAFQVAAQHLRRSAEKLVDAVVPRLADNDPLVREAAASTVAWLAEAVKDDTRCPFPDGTPNRFEPAVDPLLAVLDDDAPENDNQFEWTTQFPLSHPTRTFRGEVDAGVSRRSENRLQAAFAVALLADWFPDRVGAHDATLAALAETGDRAETRWYAIDALARAGADDALRRIRDCARIGLDDPERAASSVETLYHFITEAPAMLVPAATDLATSLPNLDADSRQLAAKALLYAAVHHPDPVESSLPVRALVREWLRDGDDEDSLSIPVGPGPVADLAVAHPECVLPVISRVLDVPLASDAPGSEEGAGSVAAAAQSAPETEPWDRETAWKILREITERDPELVWASLDSGWLRERLDRTDDRVGEVRRLYARTVPTPPPEAAVATLFEAVLAGADGARAALSTLQGRAPDAVLDAAVDVVKDAPAPAEDALAVLESLSDGAPGALAPRIEALWSWNDAIQPGDDRWSDLVTVLGRVAVATDDHDRIARMLHLEHSTYCKRFLDTPVAGAIVRAAPHKAVPALLDHLDHATPRLRKRVVRHFDALPTDHEGWEPSIRDAVLDAATDTDYAVRDAAVRTLGSWLDTLTEDVDDAGTGHDSWTSTVRNALLDRLSDDDWRVRARTVRALGDDTDSTAIAALEAHLGAEPNQTVRFEIQHVLHSLDRSNDR